MQVQTTNFTMQAQAQVRLAEQVRELGRVIERWLDGKSELYSRIAGYEVTRRLAIRTNLVTMAMVMVAAAAGGVE